MARRQTHLSPLFFENHGYRAHTGLLDWIDEKGFAVRHSCVSSPFRKIVSV